MWSLYKKKPVSNSSFLGDFSGEPLNPLKFSNGKSQEDIVREILEEIGKGSKIIFLRGKCGTGKSVVALNLARHFKKTSIVVPIKSLQEQYEKDYTDGMFILKKDRKKLKISMIKGRANFQCKFSNCTADNPELPCTIPILDKNMEKIKKYIELNDSVSKYDIASVQDVRRMTIAPSCRFWSPLLPSDLNSRALEKASKTSYNSVSGKEYSLFQREKGCGYYEQYRAYSDSDVLIFNSAKYLIETAIGRKPKTDLDIIDECDDFLDRFSEEKIINLSRLSYALSSLFPEFQEERNSLKQINAKVNSLMFDYSQDDVEKLADTEVLSLIELIIESPYLAVDDEDNYYNKVFEIAKDFEPFIEETYLSFEKKNQEGKENAFISLVTINLEARLKELLNSVNVLVLMSGTLHSEQVLKDIFGIDNFKVIDAEVNQPGTILKLRTGKEKNCKYDNFKQGLVSRKEYLDALSSCIEKAQKPVLIHVNSFEDLPTEIEKTAYSIKNIISREKLVEIQHNSQEQINKFKRGEIDLLFTTKCSRGVDFPGSQCNSIILTKYPYPNIKSLFWKILKKEMPGKFTEFYLDKARRELLQKIYRGVRFKTDHVVLLSPDVRVLNEAIK